MRPKSLNYFTITPWSCPATREYTTPSGLEQAGEISAILLTTIEIYRKPTEFAASLLQTLARCQKHGNWTKREQTTNFLCRWQTGINLKHPARGVAPRPQASGSEGVDAGGQPRQFARDGVLVQHALGGRPVQLRLGQLQGRLGRRPVAGLYRGLDLLDEGAHPAHAGTIDGGARFGLAKPFFGGFMMRHAGAFETVGAGLYRCRRRASTARSRLLRRLGAPRVGGQPTS